MASTFTAQTYPMLAKQASGGYAAGTLIVQRARLAQPAEGWDELRLEVWGCLPAVADLSALVKTFLPAVGTEATASGFTSILDSYDSPGQGRWFYQDADFGYSEDAPRCYQGEILFKGVANTAKPYRIQIDTATRDFSGENLTITSGLETFGPYPKVQTRVSEPTLTVGFPVFGADPNTVAVGASGTPPYEPELREGYWSAVGVPLRHWPYGWVLERMPIEGLAGVSLATAHWETDVWKWTEQVTPG